MRLWAFLCALLLSGTLVFSKDRKTVAVPDQFEIGRRTFIDIGPPFDYYELLVVRPMGNGASIERILLTPPGNVCTQPAKVEVVSAPAKESVASLLGSMNPCAIPEKELRRELKRPQKHLVFSGANVAMRVRCGRDTRIIRSNVLDRDLFDENPGTPIHTSQTMALMAKLDQAVGPGPLDKPILPISETAVVDPFPSSLLEDVAAGKYDSLFKDAPSNPSEVYRLAQKEVPAPTIRLLASTPVAPVTLVEPEYPQIARAAQIEGSVVLKLAIGPDGLAASSVCESGHPILCVAAKNASSKWIFPASAGGQQVQITLEFKLNCHS